MNRASYLLILALPVLLYSTGKLIARSSATTGYSAHPQQGNTGNLLDILAGDTRTLIGNAMLQKAESYYHGGLSADDDDPVATGGELDPEDPDHHVKKQARGHARFDPWRFLNSHLHAQTHMHLDRDKAEELLPWYWAACEASPHNIQAIEATSYALATMLQQPQEALRLLAKAITDNPYNVTLEITRGEILIKRLNDLKTAEQAFQAAYEKSMHEKAPRDDRPKAEALFYLGYLASQRNDSETLHRWQAIAKESMSPDLASIRDLLKIE